jgi:hypothetical protein
MKAIFYFTMELTKIGLAVGTTIALDIPFPGSVSEKDVKNTATSPFSSLTTRSADTSILDALTGELLMKACLASNMDLCCEYFKRTKLFSMPSDRTGVPFRNASLRIGTINLHRSSPASLVTWMS